MSGSSTTQVMIKSATDTSPALPVPPPRITQKLFIETHPTVTDKDKSIHSEHGVVHYPFWFGGAASVVSGLCTQPLGVAGATASITRNILYSGVRFGMYEKLKESATTPTHSPSAVTLASMGATSGFIGSIFGNPPDIVCLRMQNDPGLPAEQRRNYRNVFDGILKMARNEGPTSLFTGVWVSGGRAAIATATQLAGYDVFKRELMARTSMTDTVPTHITASCLAGFMSTFICSPLDVFKARLMTTKSTLSMSVQLSRMFRSEGVLWMFHGLTPALISRAPSTIITFVALEQLRRVYRHMHDLEE